MTSKGQVVIPKPVRDRMKWRTGIRLDVEACADGSLRLRPDQDDPIAAGMGSLSRWDALSALEAEHRAEVEADERQRKRR